MQVSHQTLSQQSERVKGLASRTTTINAGLLLYSMFFPSFLAFIYRLKLRTAQLVLYEVVLGSWVVMSLSVSELRSLSSVVLLVSSLKLALRIPRCLPDVFKKTIPWSSRTVVRERSCFTFFTLTDAKSLQSCFHSLACYSLTEM